MMSGMSKARIERLSAIAIGLCLATFPAAAQEPSPQARAAASRTERVVRDAQSANPGLRVKIDSNTGLPARVSGLAPADNNALPPIAASEPSRGEIEQAVRRFFSDTPMGSAFPQVSASTDDAAPRAASPIEYAPSNVRPDPDFPGQYIAQVQQRVDGVPIFGSSGKLTLNRALDVTQLTASFSAAPVASTAPQIPQGDAIQSARTALGANLQSRPEDDPLRGLAGRLADMPATATVTVFDPAVLRTIATPGPARLAWLVTIESFRIFIDAENRAVLHLYRDQHSALLRKVYDLNGGTTYPGAAVFDDTTPVALPNPGEDASKAFENSKKVYDYFAKKFGRDSFDDNDGGGPFGGGALEATVRYGTIKNAFWCVRADLQCSKADVMVYGPGYAGALDVVGHEMTHGVIAHEADLVYDGQPGAVNEALADIFGTLIENEQGGGNWIMGEALPGYSAAAPLRSLADPHLTGPDGVSHFDKNARFASATNRGQPDHISDLLTRVSKLCSSTGDFFNGCVHFNSGILNKAAFLISEGGTHTGISVTGIGAEKLGRIVYRSLTTKLNSASDLAEAGDAFVQSCLDLSTAGQSGFTAPDCISVEKAIQAVGLVAGS
jgi:Zn-dependent metalloprotease